MSYLTRIFSSTMLALVCLGPFLWFLRNSADLKTNRRPVFERAILTLLFIGWTAAALIVARWDTISYWLRPVCAFFFIWIAGWMVRRLPGAPRTWPIGFRSYFSLAMKSIMGFFILGAVTFALAGYERPSGAIDVSFPLRGGLFQVGHGGGSKLINYHHGHRQQSFALDIGRLYWFGGRAKWPYPTSLAAYAAYETQVVSPCAGSVREVVDGTRDEVPGEFNPALPAGNYVNISCLGVVITLAHLKPGSIAVRPGQVIQAGAAIGHVGNSGNTSEPHLHIHAVLDMPGGQGSAAVPLTFDDRFLVRGSLVVR